MRYRDLTSHMQARFRRYSTCPICDNHVSLTDDFQLVSFHHQRNIIHTFIHTNCLLTSRERGLSDGKKKLIGSY